MAQTTGRRQMVTAKNYEEFCVQVVEKILTLSKQRIQKQGRFTIALSGGSTPEGIYSLMAGHSYRDQFDWEGIDFFLGDERWVPSDNPRSNYKMIADTLLTKTKIPLSNVHAIKTNTADAQTSASLYEKELIKYFKLNAREFPQFDLILLGLGPDGHTASLFPNHPALDETKRLVIPVEAEGH